MRPKRETSRYRRATVALLATAVLLSCVCAEGLVRLAVHRDADGQDWMRDRRLRPHRLPLRQIAAVLADLEKDTAFLTYDAALGWAPRPSTRSKDGRQRVDAGGIRTDGEIALSGTAGRLRVAIFGDSFTFGDEVGQDETWGAALERGLAARGVATEVLNFGVNAYGTDQAYLRWRRVGRHYRPTVVVLGFQPENVLRNLNVFRPLYFMGSQVPFSKPRFIVDGDALVTVNEPTIPPKRVLEVLATLSTEPLLAHERFFAIHAEPWWMRSKAAALMATALADARNGPFVLSEEARDLAERIVARFAAEVHADGARFVVVHLPQREDLAARAAGKAPWYGALLRSLAARHGIVQPDAAITHLDDTMFRPHGHYAPVLNDLVGAALVDPVRHAATTR